MATTTRLYNMERWEGPRGRKGRWVAFREGLNEPEIAQIIVGLQYDRDTMLRSLSRHSSVKVTDDVGPLRITVTRKAVSP